jgi:hypothetical protein
LRTEQAAEPRAVNVCLGWKADIIHYVKPIQ